ncbi:hypothetical protein NIES4101_65300 [Calothrix sp. NIES-4101]|nr:hypothetical protein NIES4101_65300 [Calothrix sp. NIES-4101]
MEKYFFLALGFWNIIGSIFLYLMLNQKLADNILRKWTEIITQPYEIGKYGSLWLLWAATTNIFFGVINIFAINWQESSFSLSCIKKGLRSNRNGGMFYTFTSLSKNHCNITPRINFSETTSFNDTQNRAVS